MTWYTAAAIEAFACANDVSLAMDGARLGQPAEETLLMVAYTLSSGKGAHPPPQVPHARIHNKGLQL